jgi:hypothetical protein
MLVQGVSLHNISQSPCTLPMVRLYHVLALSIKENRNNFHLKVLSGKLVIRKHAQVSANSHGVSMGFCCLPREGLFPNQFY